VLAEVKQTANTLMTDRHAVQYRMSKLDSK